MIILILIYIITRYLIDILGEKIVERFLKSFRKNIYFMVFLNIITVILLGLMSKELVYDNLTKFLIKIIFIYLCYLFTKYLLIINLIELINIKERWYNLYIFFNTLIKNFVQPFNIYIWIIFILLICYDFIHNNNINNNLILLFFSCKIIIFFFSVEIFFLNFLINKNIIIDTEKYLTIYVLNDKGFDKIRAYLKFLLFGLSKYEFIITNFEQKVPFVVDNPNTIFLNISDDFEILIRKEK